MLTCRSMVLWVICCVGLASCFKRVTIDLPAFTPQLVLQGYTATGDSFRVAVNKTVAGTASVPLQETYVQNALAVLYENSVVIDTLQYDGQRKRYVSRTAVAAAGRSYTIVVSAPGFTTVEATATAPMPVAAFDITHTLLTRTTISGNRLDDVSFSFNDPVEENYYLSALYPSQLTYNHMCVYSYEPVIERSKSGLLPFDDGDCIDNEETLFTDKTFNGNRKNITLSGDNQSLHTWTDQNGQVMKPHLKLYSLSKNYYTYLKQAISNLEALEEFMTFVNPETPKGNVKNGFGIFTIFAVSLHPIP